MVVRELFVRNIGRSCRHRLTVHELGERGAVGCVLHQTATWRFDSQPMGEDG
jgi:hypothetical protein